MDSIKFTHQFLLQMTTGVNTAAFAQASPSAVDLLFSFLTTATYSSEQSWDSH
jgi:hypothetical protein